MILLLVVAALPWIMSVALRTYCGPVDDDAAPLATVTVIPVLVAVTAFSVAASTTALASVLIASPPAIAIAAGFGMIGWVVYRLALAAGHIARVVARSAEPTSELQSLMRTSYAVFCLTKK